MNFVDFVINGIRLHFWLEKTERLATVWVKKADDGRPTDKPFGQGGAERYPVFSVTCNGECFRYAGLPLGWGFRLTKDRKIKEVR
jgi:hypothetical protein